jgi:hypothetical protein
MHLVLFAVSEQFQSNRVRGAEQDCDYGIFKRKASNIHGIIKLNIRYNVLQYRRAVYIPFVVFSACFGGECLK